MRRIVTGAIAGAAAGWALNQAERRWASKRHRPYDPINSGTYESDSTRRIAKALAIADWPHLGDDAVMVHYGMAAAMGAAYGALRGPIPTIAAGWGLFYGTALWLAADITIGPALGLSRAPWDYPGWVNQSAFVSHLAYGAALEAVYKALE